MSTEIFIEGGAYEECAYNCCDWIEEINENILDCIKKTLQHITIIKQVARHIDKRPEVIFSYHIISDDNVNTEKMQSLRNKINEFITCCEKEDDLFVKRIDALNREELRPPPYPFILVNTSRPRPIKLKHHFVPGVSSRRCSI